MSTLHGFFLRTLVIRYPCLTVHMCCRLEFNPELRLFIPAMLLLLHTHESTVSLAGVEFGLPCLVASALV